MILVTGGAGYIGSHTVKALLDAGHNVIVYDNLYSGFVEAIPEKAKFILGDILDVGKLEQVIRQNNITAVVHFAAKLDVQDSMSAPIEYFQTNTGGMISLISACKNAGVKKIVFSSTAAVYGDHKTNIPISETNAKAPINIYGESKLYSEGILKSAEAYGIKSVILRYFNVAGANLEATNGQRGNIAKHIVTVSAKVACRKRDGLIINGTDYQTEDGTCVRDYIHVLDLADLHVLALNHLNSNKSSEAFNCGYSRGFSVKQVVDAMKKVSGVDFTVQVGPRRSGDPAYLVANSERVRHVLNWIPKYDNIELICKTAFEWERRI